jgi:hypothetical protein
VDSITRQQLTELVEAEGGASAAAVVEKALAQKGWQAKSEFSQEVFAAVLEAILSQARTTLVGQASVSASPKAHLAGMLVALQRHAIPLAQKGPTDA